MKSIFLFFNIFLFSWSIFAQEDQQNIPEDVETGVNVNNEADADSETETKNESDTDTNAEPVSKSLSSSLSSIEGTAIDNKMGASVEDATIYFEGLDTQVVTDENGHFAVQVPPGIYDISAAHPDYRTTDMQNIKVEEGKVSKVTIKMVSIKEMEVVTITTRRFGGNTIDMLEERKMSYTMDEVLSADQIKIAGDSDASGALKRVTGVTVVGGKYVYIRGLGERYSSTLLNGFNLPSPEAERRVVPLDMFPTGILESMVIQKTYSPDMPGEFGGGVVQLRTKSYPDQLLLKLEAGVGLNAGATFTKDEVGADKGPMDWLGIDGGHRDIPKKLYDLTKNRVINECTIFDDPKKDDCFTEEQLADLANVFPNNWGTSKETIPPDLKFAFNLGNGRRLGKTRFGFIASGLYKNEWDIRDEIRKDYSYDSSTDKLAKSNDFDFNYVTNSIMLGGILTLGAEITENNKIRANTIINRITDNSIWTQKGDAYDSGYNINIHNMAWVERMVFSQQVLGTHILNPLHDLKVDWRYAFSLASSHEPDTRGVSYRYDKVSTDWILFNDTSGNTRKYSEVGDDVHDIGIDITYPFKQWTGEEAKIKGGGAIMLKQRKRDVRRFKYENMGDVAYPYVTLDPKSFFDQDIGDLGVRLNETTEATDNASAEQQLYAGYLMGEMPLGYGFTATGGMRAEDSTQKVTSYQLFQEDEQLTKRLHNTDFLPTGMLAYKIRDDMLVRGGYGRTLNRPDFREMSPVCYYSYYGGGDICGAPETIIDQDGNKVPYTLSRAVIHNVDARWEWYPSASESISFGGFYKYFQTPIETIITMSGGSKGTEFVNAKSATNYGLELDILKNLGFVGDPLEDLYLAGNVTLVRSEVELYDYIARYQTNLKRPLQGQSPYIINLQFGYNNAEVGTTLTLLYNVFGKRIAAVGNKVPKSDPGKGLPDIYEQPFHQLDFVAKQGLGAGFALGFKARNLLDLPHEFTQGDKTKVKYRTGRSFDLSVEWTF